MINKMAKCVVYKILNPKYPDDYYIGATRDFNKRIGCHRNSCNNLNSKEHNLKVYKFIRDNDGFDNWQFEILFLFDNEDSMKKREAKLQRELKPSLNSKVEMRTKEEKKIYDAEYNNLPEVIERRKEYMKEYNSSEERKEYNKEYDSKPENKIKKKARASANYQRKKLAKEQKIIE